MRLDGTLAAREQVLHKATDWLREGKGRVLLLSGTAGSGKRDLALYLAGLLLCEKSGGDQACGSCQACLCVAADTHPDLLWLRPEDGERVLKVALVRELLQDAVPLRPQFGRAKVCLIDADALNEQGQNALLKSLEEPPPYLYFILLASSEDRLLPTIRSRAVPLRLPPLSAEELADLLQKKGYADAPASALAALTGGSPGRSLELLEASFLDRRAALWTLFRGLPARPAHRLLTEDYAFFEQEKEHYGELLDLLRSILRDLMLLAAGGTAAGLDNRDIGAELAAFYKAGAYAPQPLEKVLELIGSLQRGRKVNENFEMAVCRLLLSLREHLAVGQSAAGAANDRR